MVRKTLAILFTLFALLLFSSCTVTNSAGSISAPDTSESEIASGDKEETGSDSAASVSSQDEVSEDQTLFTDRDLEQEPDLSEAQTLSLSDNSEINITEAGIYVVKGDAENATLRIDAGDEDKVQIVLDGVSVENESAPCIYVLNADKVFVTTASGTENTLSVTGEFVSDGEVNTDAVIFSRDDLVLNGLGTLKIDSTENGIASKDDLKVTGGTYIIDCMSDGLEANETIAVADGVIEITSKKDGIHAENDEDDTTGSVYITDGSITINAEDDAIHATTVIEIDGGTLDLTAAEAIEATSVIINGGTIDISAGDDGINASQKSTALSPRIEINSGDIRISMGQGDTDAIDSNGDLVINGGTVDITARSPFDYDGQGELNGGTVTVNGNQVSELSNQMMSGMMGEAPFGGQMPDGGDRPAFGQQPEAGQMPGGLNGGGGMRHG